MQSNFWVKFRQKMNNRYQLMRNEREERDILNLIMKMSHQISVYPYLIVLDEYARLVTATESQEKRIIEDNLCQMSKQ